MENGTRGPANNKVEIPDTRGVLYMLGEEAVNGETLEISETTTIRAVPEKGFAFRPGVRSEWTYTWDENLTKQETQEKQEGKEPRKDARPSAPAFPTPPRSDG